MTNSENKEKTYEKIMRWIIWGDKEEWKPKPRIRPHCPTCKKELPEHEVSCKYYVHI